MLFWIMSSKGNRGNGDSVTSFRFNPIELDALAVVCSYIMATAQFINSAGFNGRLMLLILDLALQERRIVDSQLVTYILTEVRNLNLPRMNLLVSECVSHLNNIEDLFSSRNESIEQLVLQIIKNLAAAVMNDIPVQDIMY